MSATIAARTAVITATAVIAAAALQVVFNGISDGRWRANWLLIFKLPGIVAVGTFCLLFLYTYFRLRSNEPAEAILSHQGVSQRDEHKVALSGFVAMEYYGVILNRTFVVFIARDGLYGWKVEGPVSNASPMYFKPYADMLQDPQLMRNWEAARRLSKLKGGFFIARSDIVAADVIDRQKWGMGGIPHSGRIRIHMASGKSREFILLGSVDAGSLRQRILEG